MQSFFFSSVCLEERQKRLFWLALLCLAVKLCGFRLSFRLQGSSYSPCLQALLIPWLTWSFWSLSLSLLPKTTQKYETAQAVLDAEVFLKLLWRRSSDERGVVETEHFEFQPFFCLETKILRASSLRFVQTWVCYVRRGFEIVAGEDLGGSWTSKWALFVELASLWDASATPPTPWELVGTLARFFLNPAWSSPEICWSKPNGSAE